MKPVLQLVSISILIFSFTHGIAREIDATSEQDLVQKSSLRVFNIYSRSLCDDDSDCPGIANFCVAGSCAQPVEPGDCNDDSDCPGIANSCIAGSCVRTPEPGDCNDDSDCPGIANSCIAGSCVRTPEPGDCNDDSDCPGIANSCIAGRCSRLE